jgi:hypothetical protein
LQGVQNIVWLLQGCKGTGDLHRHRRRLHGYSCRGARKNRCQASDQNRQLRGATEGDQDGELIIAAAAVRDEGASAAYVKQSYPAVPDARVFGALKKAAGRLNRKHHCGIVRSHDSFYTDEEKELSDYWAGKGILGSDMETATLFVVGGLRKIKTGSILNVVVGPGEGTEAGVGDYASESDRLMEGERAGDPGSSGSDCGIKY